MDERGVGGHRDVAGFHQLHDFVLLAIVFQLHLLTIYFHGGFRVVVDLHVHLVAHFTCDRKVNLLVEVKAESLSAVGCERWVVDFLEVTTHLQVG